MPPADAPGADWQPSGVLRTPERSPDAQRLETALDRISAAFVRRAERQAALSDAARDVAETIPALDGPTLDEIRRRLDDAIGRIRTLLGEPSP